MEVTLASRALVACAPCLLLRQSVHAIVIVRLVHKPLCNHVVQDKRDDSILGLKSTALTFGDTHSKSIMSLFALTCTAGFSYAGVMAELATTPLAVGASAALAHMLWQVIQAWHACRHDYVVACNKLILKWTDAAASDASASRCHTSHACMC